MYGKPQLLILMKIILVNEQPNQNERNENCRLDLILLTSRRGIILLVIKLTFNPHLANTESD